MGLFDDNDDTKDFEDYATKYLGQPEDCPPGVVKMVIICPSSRINKIGPGMVANIGEVDIPFLLAEIEAMRDELKDMRAKSMKRHKISRIKNQGEDW